MKSWIGAIIAALLGGYMLLATYGGGDAKWSPPTSLQEIRDSVDNMLGGDAGTE